MRRHHQPSTRCLCSRPLAEGEHTCGRRFCNEQLARITAPAPGDVRGSEWSEAAERRQEETHVKTQ